MSAFFEKADMQDEVLRRNKGVDPDLVRRHQELENVLAELGVDTKPRFSLSPPLGPMKTILHNGKKEQ